jgi:anthranilate synthase component 2
MIVLIDNYDSFTYNLYQSIASLGFDVKVVRNDAITIEGVLEYNPEAIILSPGPKTPDYAGICLEIITQSGPQIPILGICLGHQCIAQAFGGTVHQCEEVVHGKSTYVFHQRKSLFSKMPLPFKAGRYHSLIVDKESLPDCLAITAENEAGLIMGIKHKIYPCYGVQFHPESILTPEGDVLLQEFLHEALKEKLPC